MVDRGHTISTFVNDVTITLGIEGFCVLWQRQMGDASLIQRLKYFNTAKYWGKIGKEGLTLQ